MQVSRNYQRSVTFSVAEAVVKILGDMGVQYAFGVSGGAIAPVWGESSEAAISRHATAENSTQREFHQIFSTFTREMRF